jgi:hypothetical protein
MVYSVTSNEILVIICNLSLFPYNIFMKKKPYMSDTGISVAMNHNSLALHVEGGTL